MTSAPPDNFGIEKDKMMKRLATTALAAVVLVLVLVAGITMMTAPPPPPESCTYGAARGESFASVASKNGTTVEEIKRLNPQLKEPLAFGQLVTYPCQASPQQPPAANPPNQQAPAPQAPAAAPQAAPPQESPAQSAPPSQSTGCKITTALFQGKTYFTFGGGDKEIPIGYKAEVLGGDKKVRMHWCELIKGQPSLTNVGDANAPEFTP